MAVNRTESYRFKLQLEGDQATTPEKQDIASQGLRRELPDLQAESIDWIASLDMPVGTK